MAAMAFGLFWLIWIFDVSPASRAVLMVHVAGAVYRNDAAAREYTAGGEQRNIRRGGGLLILLGYRIGYAAGDYGRDLSGGYGRKSRLAEIIRFINDILLSAPSIVVGLFVYTIVVARVSTSPAVGR